MKQQQQSRGQKEKLENQKEKEKATRHTNSLQRIRICKCPEILIIVTSWERIEKEADSEIKQQSSGASEMENEIAVGLCGLFNCNSRQANWQEWQLKKTETATTVFIFILLLLLQFGVLKHALRAMDKKGKPLRLPTTLTHSECFCFCCCCLCNQLPNLKTCLVPIFQRHI